MPLCFGLENTYIQTIQTTHAHTINPHQCFKYLGIGLDSGQGVSETDNCAAQFLASNQHRDKRIVFLHRIWTVNHWQMPLLRNHSDHICKKLILTRETKHFFLPVVSSSESSCSSALQRQRWISLLQVVATWDIWLIPLSNGLGPTMKQQKCSCFLFLFHHGMHSSLCYLQMPQASTNNAASAASSSNSSWPQQHQHK